MTNVTRSGALGRLMAVLTAIVVGWASTGHSAPNEINLQGRLLDPLGDPIDGPVNLELTIYNGFAGGTVLYAEDQLAVPLSDGVFSVVIGTGTSATGTLDATTFTTLNAFLEVAVDGEPLTPRQPFNTSAYSFQADYAADADSVDGMDAAALDQSGHVSDTGNPHEVTASQIGAATSTSVSSQIAVHSANASAHHTKTSTFGELSGTASLSQIPSSVATDSELANGLAGKANTSHTHSATQITSGTLSTSRFDAYADLSVAGRLNNSSSTDLLTRSQADGRFRTRYTRLNADCNSSVPVLGPSWTFVSNFGSISKLSTDTQIEATYYGRTWVSSFLSGNAVEFQLRVGSVTPSIAGTSLLRPGDTGSEGLQTSMSAVYPSTVFSAGTWSVSLWARKLGGGTALSVGCDPGNYGVDHVVVREVF